MSRPPELFPLFAGLETLEGVGEKTARAFEGLGVQRPKDLLYLLPHSGVDRARKASVRDVVAPCTVTVEVEVGVPKPPRSSLVVVHVGERRRRDPGLSGLSR